MRVRIYVAAFALLLAFAVDVDAQVDRREVRRGNRNFKKGEYTLALADYLRAFEKDSLSVAANYNMAGALYRQEQYDQARQSLDRIKENAAADPASAADYFYNLGDVALQQKDYQTAVDAFAQSLIHRPDDLQAKENFIYAKKMLQNQQNGGGGDQNNDQNQDQNQDQQDNQDQNQNQNDDQDKQDNQDKQQEGEDDQDKKDGQPDRKEGQPQEQPAQITPQAAQQMLQAIQAKEKETQDKVNKKKAMALQSRKKEKNW